MVHTLKHIETDLGIINIYTKLHDNEGRDVESVEIIPDKYAGEKKVIIDTGNPNKITDYLRVRLIKEKS